MKKLRTMFFINREKDIVIILTNDEYNFVSAKADDGDHSTHTANVAAGGLRLDVLHIDVHGEDGGERIERRTDGRNKGGSKQSHHQSYHANREDIRYHEEVGIVGMGRCGENTRLAKRVADDARDDVNGHIENLQPTAEICSFLPFVQIPGGKHRLYH